MSHTCHAHGCSVAVPPRMFMCRQHWYRLRKATRDAIWREYRPGQEEDKRPSLRYLAVQQYAIAEVLFRPGDNEAAKQAGRYVLQSEFWRREAIENGHGDPLEGIARKKAAS